MPAIEWRIKPVISAISSTMQRRQSERGLKLRQPIKQTSLQASEQVALRLRAARRWPLRTIRHLRTEGGVIGPTERRMAGIAVWKQPAHGGVVRMLMDHAAAMLVEGASAVPRLRAVFLPEAPLSLLVRIVEKEIAAKFCKQGRPLLRRESRPMFAAHGIVRAWVTGQWHLKWPGLHLTAIRGQRSGRRFHVCLPASRSGLSGDWRVSPRISGAESPRRHPPADPDASVDHPQRMIPR